MTVKFTDDGKFLKLNFDNLTEKEQIEYSFIKNERNFYIKQKINKYSKTKVNYLLNGNLVPIGMWQYLLEVCSNFKFKLYFPEYDKLFINISKSKVEEFCHKLLENNNKYTPRPYQVEAVYRAVKYRNATLYLSVSAGKTFIMYMVTQLLLFFGIAKKILIITIKPSLSSQHYIEFKEEYHCIPKKLNIFLFNGSSLKNDKEENNIYIGNYQSLRELPETFFHRFDAVLFDEAHHVSAPSIQKILSYCKNAKHVSGYTGSIREGNHSGYYDVLAHIGPIVYKMTKRDLIEMGSATDGSIEVFYLDSFKKEDKIKLYELKESESISGEKLLRIEQQMIRDNQTRLIWLCTLISKFNNKNVLVYFESVKDKYGEKIVNMLKSISQDKNIFYIDESVPTSSREHFKQVMETSVNNILVATYKTWSTGESVKNLHVVVCAEAIKDELTVSQIVGRPMRSHSSKEKFLWIDIVDDLSVDIGNSFTNNPIRHINYMLRWSKERIKQFNKDKFVINTHRVSLVKSVSGSNSV